MMQMIIGSVAVVGSLVVLWWTFAGNQAQSAAASRNLAAGLPAYTDLRQAVLSHSATDRALTPFMRKLAHYGRRLTPAGRIDALERRMVLAGMPPTWPVERVLALKVGGSFAGLLLGGLLVLNKQNVVTALLWCALSALGFFAPDIFLINQSQKRRILIRKKLPDTLDQLTITVEAGLGFDAAMARVTKTSRGPLADELARTLQDVKTGMTRREALHELSERVDVPELRSFVSAVIQAERYGLPIAPILRIQASELRSKRRQAAEEKALKLPVKMLFPTVVFIFPTLFIVLLGPAIIQIADIFQ